jgi:hypothetical protein
MKNKSNTDGKLTTQMGTLGDSLKCFKKLELGLKFLLKSQIQHGMALNNTNWMDENGCFHLRLYIYFLN